MTTLNTSLVDPELLRTFAFWGSILCLKVVAVVALTGRLRFKKQIFINTDDVEYFKKGKVVYTDPDIERNLQRAYKRIQQ
ncbi:Prostaglandin E synthase [Anthophora quadrimaculata]